MQILALFLTDIITSTSTKTQRIHVFVRYMHYETKVNDSMMNYYDVQYVSVARRQDQPGYIILRSATQFIGRSMFI